MSLVERCARTAGIDLGRPGTVVDERGSQNLVLLQPDLAVAWRFPRTAHGCAWLPDAAARLGVLGAAGLPVPRVIDLRAAPEPGDGYLLLSYCAGVPLDTVSTDALPTRARDRLLGSLAELLAQLHEIPAARWPTAVPAWAAVWDALARTVEDRADLPIGLQSRQIALTRHAATVAHEAPIGIFHGDLGGVNCRVDPVTGAVQSLLDWDSATVGDTATDIAAILAGLGPATADAMRLRNDHWRSAERRYGAYVATWPVQYYLWACSEGSAAECAAATGLLSAAPSRSR